MPDQVRDLEKPWMTSRFFGQKVAVSIMAGPCATLDSATTRARESGLTQALPKDGNGLSQWRAARRPQSGGCRRAGM